MPPAQSLNNIAGLSWFSVRAHLSGLITQNPPPMEWRAWQQSLEQMLSLGHNLTLPIPLGKWWATPSHTDWWFYHPREEVIFHQTLAGTTRKIGNPHIPQTMGDHQLSPTTEQVASCLSDLAQWQSGINQQLLMQGRHGELTTPGKTASPTQY